MTRPRRIVATVVIVAATTLGVAGVANASESHSGRDWNGHDNNRCNHSNDYRYNDRDNRYGDRYNDRDNRYNDRYNRDRGLVGQVLCLVDNIL